MDIENNSRPSDENTSSDKMDEKEIEITGEGAPQGDIEESQQELERIEKREMEKKKFLEELDKEAKEAGEESQVIYHINDSQVSRIKVPLKE